MVETPPLPEADEKCGGRVLNRPPKFCVSRNVTGFVDRPDGTGQTLARCAVSRSLVPLLSERKTTVMSPAGYFEPLSGLVTWFQFVNAPEKMPHRSASLSATVGVVLLGSDGPVPVGAFTRGIV